MDNLYSDFPIFVTELKNEPIRYDNYRNAVISYLFKASKEILKHISPTKPGKRLENRYKLRIIIRNCTGFLFWDDPFFDKELFDFMDELIENDSIKEIRLLGSITKQGFSNDFLEDFKKISKEFSEKDKKIHFKIETVDKNRNFHNRYIITSEFMYDLPSISEFNRGRTASFSYSETDSIEYKDISNEYEKWWNSNTAFDLILDWEKIQNAINDFRGIPKPAKNIK